MSVASPLRYPGGKAQMTTAVQRIRTLNNLNGHAVAEPFAGGAGLSLTLLYRRETHKIHINDLDPAIHDFWRSAVKANPALIAARGVGADTAAALLIAAGDNPQRLRSEASFAALCGACPVEASSGRTVRHRLNRGGDRQANNALWRIATVRLRCDQQTKDYAARRRAEGNNDREIIRCLKRYIAREIYRLLTDPPVVPHGADLRQQRQLNAMTLDTAAAALNAWPTRISNLERGLIHDRDLAERYQQHLTQITT